MQTITVKFKLLKPNKAKLIKLINMLETYNQACLWFLKQAIDLDTTNRTQLHRKTYQQACELFDLNRATLQCAMFKALSAYRSYKSLKRKGEKASLPKFQKTIPAMIRQDCYFFVRLPSGNWIVKFPVSSGRSQIYLPIITSDYHLRKLQDLTEGLCRKGSLEIWKSKKGEWYMSVSLVYNTHIDNHNPEKIIGVDFGIVKLAVLSNNKFFDGRQIRWRKERWAERRKALQKAGRLSRVKKESGRERRWMQYINHCISKKIVEITKSEGKSIALENLVGIRKRIKGSKKFNRMMNGWNFRELSSFIEYKANLAGVPVIYVDPKETSRTCPRCGNVSRYNRKEHRWFKCTQCNYQSDVDRIGALNIASKAYDALRACPWEKGERDTPNGQGSLEKSGECWLTRGNTTALC